MSKIQPAWPVLATSTLLLCVPPVQAVDAGIEQLQSIQAEVRSLGPVTAGVGARGVLADDQVGSGAGSGLSANPATMDVPALMDLLRERQPGSFHLMSHLSDAQKRSVLDAYRRQPDMQVVRHAILEQLRLSWLSH